MFALPGTLIICCLILGDGSGEYVGIQGWLQVGPLTDLLSQFADGESVRLGAMGRQCAREAGNDSMESASQQVPTDGLPEWAGEVTGDHERIIMRKFNKKEQNNTHT